MGEIAERFIIIYIQYVLHLNVLLLRSACVVWHISMEGMMSTHWTLQLADNFSSTREYLFLK